MPKFVYDFNVVLQQFAFLISAENWASKRKIDLKHQIFKLWNKSHCIIIKNILIELE